MSISRDFPAASMRSSSESLRVEQWKSIIDEGIRRSGFAEAIAYLQVTRGCAPRHRGMPKDVEPTIVMTVRQLGPPPTKVRETGIAVITVPEFRWGRCDIKSIALLPSVLAYQAARKAGANDAIFVGDDDTVNESTAGNVFIVTSGRLRTPPKGTRILPGVTRDKLLEAARAAGLQTVEEQIAKADLYAAEKMFLTSTTAEVVPVVTVDGKPIGTGKTWPVSNAGVRAIRADVYPQVAVIRPGPATCRGGNPWPEPSWS